MSTSLWSPSPINNLLAATCIPPIVPDVPADTALILAVVSVLPPISPALKFITPVVREPVFILSAVMALAEIAPAEIVATLPL